MLSKFFKKIEIKLSRNTTYTIISFYIVVKELSLFLRLLQSNGSHYKYLIKYLNSALLIKGY